MRVCFIFPSYDRHSNSNPELEELISNDGYLGAPAAAIPLLAALTPEQHEIVFVDDRIEELPCDDGFDLVAMPVFTPAATRAMEIGDAFRRRGTKVVVGGVFPSLMPEQMAPHADAVCIGEGEPVWRRILEDAERGELQPVYRAAEAFDLERLPPPRYDLFHAKEGADGYRSTGPSGEMTVDYPVQLSRGCPLQCLACALPASMGTEMRHAPADWVEACFRSLYAGDRRRYVALTEDTSSLPTAGITRRVTATLERCVDVGPRVSYMGLSPSQAMLASNELYDCLRRLDTVSLYLVFGFDSWSRQAFAAASDERAARRCLDAVERVRDQGIGVYASLLVGHDEEDEGVFDRVLSFCETAALDTVEFAILTPYPGTPLWHRLVVEDRLITTDWRRYNDANPTYRPTGYSADRLREGYLYLWREFYRNRRPAHAIQV